MDAAFYARLTELVADAMEQPADARAAFIERASAGDPALQTEALRLITHDVEDDTSVLSDEQITARRRKLDRAIDAGTGVPGSEIDDPDAIDGYTLVRRIGEGGMGVVYEAVQITPRRRVAIKIVDAIRSSPDLEARLRAEAEIQGRLQHVGIAQVHGAGSTVIGRSPRPWFAMEYVEGRAIGAYADELELDNRDRLALVAAVAEAIGYAHTHGIVHRDLKPENILVGRDGHSKILDFGIARVTGDATLAATTMTRDGQILGTLAYMAPEQISGCPDDVTPRADVYALGVIAFELLAGRPPVELAGLSISAAIRHIEFAEPPRLGAVVPGVTRDVETIVGTCLSRDPAQRYADGAALAADIRRFLCHKPILARPATRMYRARKFVQRNTALVGGVAATMLVLILGVIVATVLAIGQHQARLDAEARGRVVRSQQLRISAPTFQRAADHVIAGDVASAVESLESIPPDLRSWGWDLLASSVPRWMPGDGVFGIMTYDHGYTWSGAPVAATFENGAGVLTMMDQHLLEWDPVSNAVIPRLPEQSVAQIQTTDGPRGSFIRLILPDMSLVALDTRSWSIQPLPQNVAERAPEHLIRATTDPVIWSDVHSDQQPDSRSESWSVWTPNHGVQSVDAIENAWTPRIIGRLRDSTVLLCVPLGGPFGNGHHPDPPRSQLALLDASTGSVIAQSESSASTVCAVIMPDRREIAAAPIEADLRRPLGPIVIHDISTLEVIRTLDLVARPIAYLPSSDLIVAADVEGGFWFVDPDKGRKIAEVIPGMRSVTSLPPIAPDASLQGGDSVLVMSPKDPPRPLVVDAVEPEHGLRPAFVSRALPGALYHLAVSQQGGLLATMSPWQDLVSLVDARTGEVLTTRTMHSVQQHRWDAALWFSPEDGDLLATVEHADGTGLGLARWNIASGERGDTPAAQRITGGHKVPTIESRDIRPSMSLSSRHVVGPDGSSILFTGSGENSVRRRGLEFREPEVLPWNSSEGIALHPDGQYLAAVLRSGARIIDVHTGAAIAQPIKDPDRLLCAAWSPDGSTLAVGSLDGRIFVIETEHHTLLYAFQSTPPEDGRGPLFVHDLRWSPDSRTLYAAHAGGVISAWNAHRPHERRAAAKAWAEADARMATRLDEMMSDGRSLNDAGAALLRDSSLTANERAAVEVVLVRRWPSETIDGHAPLE